MALTPTPDETATTQENAMTETLASVQADTDHTARRYAALATLAHVPASDLHAWLTNTDDDLIPLISVIPAGDGFALALADDHDGHPVVASIAVPAGSTPATLGVDADDPRAGVSVAEVAAELNDRWEADARARAATEALAGLDARWADVEI